MLREHEPVVIDNFGGLWQRGDDENCPIDHFTDGENFKFVGNRVETRDGLGIHQTVVVPLGDIKRIYNYPTQTANTLLVLKKNGANGEIYHVVNSTTIFGPILTVAGMDDFAFIPYAGRAYISPFKTYVVGALNVEKGLQNEFLYVYKGDGTPARKAAGTNLSGTPTVANGVAGLTDAGFHLFGFVAETDTGYLTAPSAIVGFTTFATSSVSFGNIPTSGSPTFVKRHLVATKVIASYNGNTTGYQFFFVPNATINNNIDIFLNNISFFDADLLEDASYLLDNFSEIAAGNSLWLYHNRLCLGGQFNDISLVRISTEGEPEAINQIDGLCIVPPDGNAINNGNELRDVMYVFKRSRTAAFVDNGDVPSSWPIVFPDNALGCGVHGIATVLDSGGSTTDFFIVATYAGIALFNGQYVEPELSWKVEDLWTRIDQNQFGKIQIVNAPIQGEIYCCLPDGRILVGNYSKGMNPKAMRWAPWRYHININTTAIVNIDEIIFGADI